MTTYDEPKKEAIRLLDSEEPPDNALIYTDSELERRHDKRKRNRTCIISIASSIALVIIIVVPLIVTFVGRSDEVPSEEVPVTPSDSILGVYQHAAVASDSEQCSVIGRNILRQGGSAIDSAIATLLCLGLINAHSAGIGGGFLLTYYQRETMQVFTIDAREVAPLSAHKTMFADGTSSEDGGLAIAVPGEVRGYYEIHKRFGKLPWTVLFEPAINMAKYGFPVSQPLSDAISHTYDEFYKWPLKTILTNPATNTSFKPGEIMTRPKLAKTLQTIAEDPDDYYTGTLADDVIADINDQGGNFTLTDLQNYTVRNRVPVITKLTKGYSVYGLPPPGNGVILAFILGILDGYNITESVLQENSLATNLYHRIIEAFKFAFAKRLGLGDEDYVNVTEIMSNLTSAEYAAYIRTLIWDNQTHSSPFYGPIYSATRSAGTCHLSLVAENGDAVAITSTINTHFGSKVYGTRTGIIFNNEMDDFGTPNKPNSEGLAPSPANYITPGKRPLSNMCPTVMVDELGDARMVIGGAGGSTITTQTVFAAIHVLWLGKNIKEAIDAKRLHNQYSPAVTEYETGFRQIFVDSLINLGHNLSGRSMGVKNVQGITREGDYLYANSDFRKGGVPAGY